MKKVIACFGRFAISSLTNDVRFMLQLDPELPLETRAYSAFQRGWKEDQIESQPHLDH